MRYEIDFTAGYGSSGVDVPQPLRQAIRLLVTHWYEHRSAVGDNDDAAATPFGESSKAMASAAETPSLESARR